MKRKLLSVLLVICMVLTLMPMTAFAAEIAEVSITLDVDDLTTESTPPVAALGDEYEGVTIATEWYSGDTKVTEFASAATYTAKITVTLEDGTEVTAYKLNGETVTPDEGVITTTATVTAATPTPTTYTVSGTVAAGETEANVVGITVALYKIEEGTSTATGKTDTTKAGGAFSFTEVAAGDYEVVVAAVEGSYLKSTSGKLTVSADKDDVTVTLEAEPVKEAPTITGVTADENGKYAVEKEVTDTVNVAVATDATAAITASSSNASVATAAVTEKAVTITAKGVGTAKITINVPEGEENAAGKFEITVTVKEKVLPLTVAVYNTTLSDLGNMNPATLQTLSAPVQDLPTKTWKIRGTSNWTANWPAFSDVEGQSAGNYIVLKLTSEGNTIKITSPSEGVEKTLDADGILVTNLKNFPSNKATVKVVNGDITTNWTLDLSGVTKAVLSDDASLTAAATDAAVSVTEAATNAIATPDEIAISFPADTAATAVSGASIELTVDPNAEVKYVIGTTAPTTAAGFTASGTNTDGTVTVTGDLSGDGAALFVMVTAQDGKTVKYYKITAAVTVIKVAAADSAVTDAEAITDATKKTDAATAIAEEAITSTALQAVALDAAAQNPAINISAEEVQEKLGEKYTSGDDVYVLVVPYVEVIAKEYTEDSYTVDITPKAHVYASTATTYDASTATKLVDDIEITETGDIAVTIGIPTGIAADGNLVKITHGTDTYVEKVASNAVTITVSHFSEFTVEKIDGLTLDSLTVSQGTLTPAFDADTTEYTVEVANSVSEITVTAKAATGITVTVKKGGNAAANGLVDLDEGVNAIIVELTASGATTVNYTINVTRNEATTETPSGNGGGGGGSSKPTTPDEPSDDPTKPEFNDVDADSYYADAVAWAVENGITNGTSATTFSPNASCTRAQMVTFLWRLAGSPKAEGENPFADVADDAYYYDAVIWAVANGITNGTSETAFSPDDTVSRAQSVTFLYRYAGEPEAADDSAFEDVAADAYYCSAVAWAAANAITNGTSETTFSPDNACVRAQIVTFMYRYDGIDK